MNTVFAKVDTMLDEMYTQMEAELLSLLRFTSVREDAKEGSPFVRPVVANSQDIRRAIYELAK